MAKPHTFDQLQSPLIYRPYIKGVYQVAPLLRPFGSTTENDVKRESHIFQFDNEFKQFYEEKIKSLSERKSKYFGTKNLEKSHEIALIDFMLTTLCREHPSFFSYQSRELQCHLSGDVLKFDSDRNLLKPIGPATTSLEALTLQVQEDFSLWRFDDNKDWMALGSICLPNHWDPEEKIGKNFFEVHVPVAESGPMIKNSAQIVQTMIQKGPFVRFAWGLATDTRLNHHPNAPDNIPAAEWAGRCFDPAEPKLWVRSERQSLHGFPELNMSFFTIRSYFEDVESIKKDPDLLQALILALRSMTPASLEYKGLSKSLDSILIWLDA